MIGRSVYIEELVKKDYKGDTPIHTAAKNGNIAILEFFLSGCTKNFLDIQNDFSFTIKDCIQEKIMIIEEKQPDLNEDDND